MTEAWAAPGEETAVGKDLGHPSPVTVREYDADGNLVAVTDPRMMTSRFEYDLLGRKTFARLAEPIQLPPGYVPPETRWEYDAADRKTAEIQLQLPHPDGGRRDVRTAYVYDPLDRTVRVIEAVGTPSERHTVTDYDAADHPLRVTENLSPNATRTTVDGKVVPYSNPTVAGYQYDPLGRTRRVDGAMGLLEPEIEAKYGHTRPWTDFQYDPSGRVTVVRTNVSNSTAGDRVAVTHNTYDDLFRLTDTVEGAELGGNAAEARKTGVRYDSADNVTWFRDGSGLVTRSEYDLLGHKTKTGSGTEMSAAAGGALLGGLYTTYAYDAFGDAVLEDPPVGKTKTEYDLLGRAKVVWSANGGGDKYWQKTEYTYDRAGNRLAVREVVYPSWYEPGTDGKPVVVGPVETVIRTTTTSTQYDPLGRVTATTDPYGKSTGYDYDQAGRVVKVVDRNGRIRYFAHDELGRTVREYWATGWAVENIIVSYPDAAGGVVYTFEGMTATVNEFDPVTGPRPVAVPGTWAVNPDTWTTQSFDALGRLASSSAPHGGTLAYAYDAAGQLIAVADPQGGRQTAQRDLAGRVRRQTLVTPEGKGAYFYFSYKMPGYDTTDLLRGEVGRSGPTQTSPAVVELSVWHNSQNRERLRVWRELTTNKNRERLELRYQDQGLVEWDFRTGTAPGFGFGDISATYTYDGQGQGQIVSRWTMVDSKLPGTTVSTPRDAAGSLPYASEAVARTGTGYRPPVLGDYYAGYDGEGNLTSYVWKPQPNTAVPDASKWKLEYDHRNRLVAVTIGYYDLVAGNSSWRELTRVDYKYDTLDRLIETRVTEKSTRTARDEYGRDTLRTQGEVTVTRHVYVGNTPYADLTGADQYALRYLFGPSGQPLARADAGGPLFYLTDRQNSVLQIVNPAGQTVKRIRYEGTRVGQRGSADPAFHDRLELGGNRSDFRTGLIYVGGHWLDGENGRFVTEGGGGLGLNPYPVAGNSWVNRRPADDDEPGFWAGPIEWAGRLYLRNEGFRKGFDRFSAALHFVGGVTDSLTGLTSLVAKAGGYDGSYRTQADATAWGWGSGIGTVVGIGGTLVAGFRAFSAVARTGRAAQAAMAAGNTARAEKLMQMGSTARTYLRVEAAEAAFHVTMGARDVATSGWNWSNGLLIAGGLLGVRLNLGVIATAGAASRATRGYLAAENWFLTQTALGRGVATTGRAAGTAAHFVTELGLKVGVHGVMKYTPGLSRYHNTTSAFFQRMGFKVCFAAGTPLRTPDGSCNIEDIRAGDLVLSRDEHRPDGLVVAQTVEEVFVREGLVWHLRVGGRVIRTTAEHPFYRAGDGWVACHDLRAGDRLLTEDGAWAAVEDVRDTGAWETVYNLRVADFHTYFVGTSEWGFAVWAHNADYHVADYLNEIGLSERLIPKVLEAKGDVAKIANAIPAKFIEWKKLDLASVVNEVAQRAGLPVVLHHGTRAPASAFAGGIDVAKGGGQLGPGFYASTDPAYVEFYSRAWKSARTTAGGEPAQVSLTIPAEVYSQLKVLELKATSAEYKALNEAFVFGREVPKEYHHLYERYDVLISHELLPSAGGSAISARQFKFNPRTQPLFDQLAVQYRKI